MVALCLLWWSGLLLVRSAGGFVGCRYLQLFALKAGSRFKAAVKVPIAFREKLLAGKQEVAGVAEVAGDAERMRNGGSKATVAIHLWCTEKQEASSLPTAARAAAYDVSRAR